jgi:hypothetical protein
MLCWCGTYRLSKGQEGNVSNFCMTHEIVELCLSHAHSNNILTLLFYWTDDSHKNMEMTWESHFNIPKFHNKFEEIIKDSDKFHTIQCFH